MTCSPSGKRHVHADSHNPEDNKRQLKKEDKEILKEDGSFPFGHNGFEQLAIIYEKQGQFEKAIELSQEALTQGWASDWENRISRCRKKIEKKDSKKK